MGNFLKAGQYLSGGEKKEPSLLAFIVKLFYEICIFAFVWGYFI